MISIGALPAPQLAEDGDAVAMMGVLWSCRREIPLKAHVFNGEGLQWLRDHCRQGRVWVVKAASPHERDDEEIAGMMLIAPPSEPAGMKTEHHEVFWIAVDPAYRKRGVALSLLRHAKTLHECLVAKAQEKNTAVRALLERERFQVAGATQPGGWVPYDWLRDEDEESR